MNKNEIKMLHKIALVVVSAFTISSLAIYIFINHVFNWNFTLSEASSIAIIGGVDGPTSTFVAKSTSSSYFHIYSFLVFLILAIVYITFKLKREK